MLLDFLVIKNVIIAHFYINCLNSSKTTIVICNGSAFSLRENGAVLKCFVKIIQISLFSSCI